MNTFRLTGLAGCCMVTAAVAVPEPRSVYETENYQVPRSRIDDFILARLKAQGTTLAPPCSDAVFVRRVYLDLIGTLPTSGEAEAFLDDIAPDKRAKLIDALFQRDEFADHWSTKWCDLLRVKAEFPINLWPNPAQTYHRWLRSCMRTNLPLDRMARRLLTSTGSNMRVPESNFFRAVQSRDPASLATAVSLTFMGARQEAWSGPELEALSSCFSRVGYKSTVEWKEEIVFFDLSRPAPMRSLGMPAGAVIDLPPDVDPRAVFTDWLVNPENPWFSRNFANRAWFWIFGRGIVEEPDDFRFDNPPSHPELLRHLAAELSSHHYDMRHLLRLITNSRTYQQSPVPAGKPCDASLFDCYRMRRLDAEVMVDALCSVTKTSEQYSSLIPEPFTFLPEGTRAISLPDGSISSSFLELFGRPPRDSGLAAERNSNPSAAQRLHFLNSSHVRKKIEGCELVRGSSGYRSNPNSAISSIYLTLFSRRPTPEESAVCRETLAQSGNRRDSVIDLVWALLNTNEFLCRH